ncbi:hypothetical protein GCM10008906_37360 [Clostridium oceanicum]|uniref:Uncharacterized protein n=1 Tax=Clostridium oceanicum TaxID=1543 RepID=A0ABN1JWA8_9CLOT
MVLFVFEDSLILFDEDVIVLQEQNKHDIDIKIHNNFFFKFYHLPIYYDILFI